MLIISRPGAWVWAIITPQPFSAPPALSLFRAKRFPDHAFQIPCSDGARVMKQESQVPEN